VYLGAVPPPARLWVLAAGVAFLACASPSAASGVAAGPGGSGGAGGATPAHAAPGEPAPPTAEARATLARFASALRDGRWGDAWALLSSPWMARLTPDRLASDWRESGPVGPRALARVEAALAAGLPVVLDPGGLSASLPVGEGKAASLVLEDGRWRVAALE
jgi:hypothetical protein